MLTELSSIIYFPLGLVLGTILISLLIFFLKRKYFRWYLPVVLFFTGLIILFSVVFFISPATYEDGFSRTIFAEGKYQFQTASRKYHNQESGDTVTLVGICHIGRPDFYRELLDGLFDYDHVLYEGVVPVVDKPEKEKTKIIPEKKNKKTTIPKKIEYLDLAEALGIEPQSFHINPGNSSKWTWCDIIYQDLLDEAKNRGFNVFKEKNEKKKLPSKKDNFIETTSFRQLFEISNDNLIGQILILKYYLTNGDLKRTKRMLFNQPHYKEKYSIETVASKQMKYLIIDFRNKWAIKEMGVFLVDPQLQNIAILYGAAHMPGMEKLLEAKGFKPVSNKTWTTVFTY